MTAFKIWPIGLQSGPTGRPTGIGEMINDLTHAGIAMFSAASDSTSIIYDLQEARRKTGVPHTGNFIPTGYVDDYHISVPEYRTPHAAKLAVRHWDAVEKKGIPKEIDWNIPCIWMSTWNEIRPYVGWGSTEKLEDWDEPLPGYEGYADLIGWQAVEIGKEALKRGYRWAAFGFAGGNPEPGFWLAPGVVAYLRLCHEHPDRLGVALHEYSFADTLINRPDHMGRFQQLHHACDQHGLRHPVIQFKEFGWQERWVPEPDKAMPQLLEIAKMYAQHPNIHGAGIWTVQGGWGGLYKRVQKLISPMHKAALVHAQPMKDLPAPVVTGGVPIEPDVAVTPVTTVSGAANSALASGFTPGIDLDNVPVDTTFRPSWTFINNGQATWNGGYRLAYTLEPHPDTTGFDRAPLNSQTAFAISEIGAGSGVRPGQSVRLTLNLTAPQTPGTYATNWQLQAPDGHRFGPIRWLRAIVTGDVAVAPSWTLAYESLAFKNSIDNFDNMLPGRQFSATWTLRNTGTRPWSGDFQIAYVDRDTGTSPQTVRDPMGTQLVTTLRQVSGRELVNPGETVAIRRDLIAPQHAGAYKFHWEMRDTDGRAFGGIRWLQIGVTTTGSGAPAAQPRPFQPGMNLNPEVHDLDLERLGGLSWVRFPFFASRLGLSPEDAYHQRYRHLIQSYASAGIKTLLILHQDTEGGAAPWTNNGDWGAYAAVFAQACGRVAAVCREFGDMVAYQIFNEQDSDIRNKSAIGIEAKNFALVLDKAAQAIGNAHPGATIVLGGLNTGPRHAIQYVRDIQQQLNGRLPVDALACHPYGRYVKTDSFYNKQFGTLADSLNQFKQAFPDKPMWITEFGIPGHQHEIGPEHYQKIAQYLDEVVDEVTNNYADYVPVLVWFAWTDAMENAGVLKWAGKIGDEKEHIYDSFLAMKQRGENLAKSVDLLESLESLSDAKFLFYSSTLADQNAVPAASTFTSRFRFKNSGATTWGEGYKLVYVPQGDHPHPMMSETSFDLAEVAAPIPVEPGEEVEITLNMTAPSKSGRLYRSRWQLRDPEGLPFAYMFEELTVVPAATAGTNVQHSDMAFVADHTIADGTPLVAGSDFRKQWRVRNTGARKWSSGFRLVYIEGDLNMSRGSASHMVPEAKVGEEVILSVAMTAPSAKNGQPTSYSSLWRLQDDRGNIFGDPIWARIVSTTAVTDAAAQGTALARLLNDPSSWYSQTDPAWAKVLVGHGQKRIATWGCLMTCMAMAMTAFGERVTPPQLNEKLKPLGEKGFIDSDVRFLAPQRIGGPRFGGNAASWKKDSNANQPWIDDDPIRRIDNALAQGNIVVAQVDTNTNNTIVDQHWVIIVKRTADGSDYQMLDPLTPHQHVGSQPKSLMDKYGQRVPSLSNETNLRNAIKSAVIYLKPAGSGG
jgi:hypothetical protein